MNDIRITGNIIQYFYICKRKIWLAVRQISGDQDNMHLEMGRFISDSTYKRNKKEIRLENILIDISKLDNENVILGEVKKSSTTEKSARMQLCFYLYTLREYGIEAEGELLFPKEKKKEKVVLDDYHLSELDNAMEEIKSIASRDYPPPAVKIKYCKGCAYMEFCWS